MLYGLASAAALTVNLMRHSAGQAGDVEGCAGQMGLSVAELRDLYPGEGQTETGPVKLRPGPMGSFVAEAAIPVAACQELAELATPLLLPAVQKRDSVDGGPEFQVDLLEPAGEQILARLWPDLARHTLPIMQELVGAAGDGDHRGNATFPMASWSTDDRTGVRISDMFVRRYYRPPREQLRHGRGAGGDSAAAAARENSRWRLSQHQDAAELSVSIELSDPSSFQGGLYLGKRLGYQAGSSSSSSSSDGSGGGRWKTAETLPPMARGSAVIHRGNLTHGVSVKAGERWSLIMFWFHSCAAQMAYFGPPPAPPPPPLSWLSTALGHVLREARRWLRNSLGFVMHSSHGDDRADHGSGGELEL